MLPIRMLDDGDMAANHHAPNGHVLASQKQLPMGCIRHECGDCTGAPAGKVGRWWNGRLGLGETLRSGRCVCRRETPAIMCRITVCAS